MFIIDFLCDRNFSAWIKRQKLADDLGIPYHQIHPDLCGPLTNDVGRITAYVEECIRMAKKNQLIANMDRFNREQICRMAGRAPYSLRGRKNPLSKKDQKALRASLVPIIAEFENAKRLDKKLDYDKIGRKPCPTCGTIVMKSKIKS